MTERTVAYQGINFRVYNEDVRMPDGSTKIFEYVWRRDGTRVLCVREDMHVLLIDEYRYETDSVEIRLPGGKLDSETELPIDAAARELTEETGLVAEELRLLSVTIPFATVRYRIHFFLATHFSEGTPAPDQGEKIVHRWVSASDAVRMAMSGDIREEISALAIIRFFSSIIFPSPDKAR